MPQDMEMQRSICVALLVFALPAAAQTVTDGDTIKFGTTIYRLWGIDPPETHQLCDDGWPAGQEATKAMRGLVEGRTVVCEPRGQDRYKRTIALCRADGVDLGAAMVRAGMAWAFVRYSRDYVDQEHDAQAERRGVHDHVCVLPWEWRARQR